MSILIYMLKKINEWKDRFSVPTFTWLEWTRNSHFETLNLLDQCQHLSKCASTTPLIQQQSSDNYLGLNLGKGRGRYAVAQMLTCHWSKLFMAAQNIIGCDFTVKISLIPYNRDRNFYLRSHPSPPPPLEKYLWKFVFYNQSLGLTERYPTHGNRNPLKSQTCVDYITL